MISESWLSTIYITTIGSHIDFNKQFFILHVLIESYNKEVFNEEKKDKDTKLKLWFNFINYIYRRVNSSFKI